MLFSQTMPIPNQLLSRLDHPAIRAPAQTEKVQRQSFHSNLVFLKASNTTIVLKIAHLRNARNIGILMYKMLYVPHKMVAKFVIAACKEKLAFSINCWRVGTAKPYWSSLFKECGLSVFIVMSTEPKVTLITAWVSNRNIGL